MPTTKKKPSPLFVRLDDVGKPVSTRAKHHAQVHDTATGLIWSAEPIAVTSWKDAEAQCKGCRVGGRKDWRLPTVTELISIVDYAKREPAIDTKFFRMPSDGTWLRFWSSSPVVGWPEGAWFVYFSYGYVGSYNRNSSGFVRPVRVARPRQ